MGAVAFGAMKLSVVILPSARWAQAEERWRRCEALGFDAAYTYDHLSWRDFRDRPWFAMVPTLSAAALATSRIAIGPLVTTPNFRHPVALAKDLVALDDLCAGRLVVGVGAGGRGFDATVLGDPAWGDPERHERFVEFTTLLVGLLRGEVESAGGEYYRADGVRLVPGPHAQVPPVLVSAMGPKAIDLAARLGDGWVSVGRRPGEDVSTYDAVRRQVERLDAALERHGRSSYRRVLLDSHDDERPQDSLEAFTDWAGRYRALGFDEVVIHWPEPGTSLDFPVEAFEEIATTGRERLAVWA